MWIYSNDSDLYGDGVVRKTALVIFLNFDKVEKLGL